MFLSLQMLDYNVPGGVVETHPKIFQDFLVLHAFSRMDSYEILFAFCRKVEQRTLRH